ncbi:MAG: hypothetical protein ACREEM_21605, partial [Blastocatellia bacterium]
MTYKRFLQIRVQQTLVAGLIGALLITSLPLSTQAVANSAAAPHAMAAKKGGAALASTAARGQGAVGPNLAAAKGGKLVPKATKRVTEEDICDAVVPRNGPEWGDRQGWNFAPNYLNIKLADIDGDGKAELLGRAGDAVKVYGWDTQN